MTMVSVIVATYRRESELKKALVSLARQTYKEIEIILVDDNCDEKWNEVVSQIVEAFKEANPDVTLLYIANTQNLGSARTRNVGINAASGQYVTFLDDDDLYLPQKVEKQVAFMEQSNCDYSITDLNLYSENDRLIDTRVRSYIQDTSPEALNRYHLMYHLTGTDTLMFTKKYLDEIGGFPPIDVGDEFYLMHRAILGNGKFGYLPGCDVKAYVHSGKNSGVSSGEGKIRGENELYEYKKQYFGRLNKESVRYIKMRHHAVLTFANIRIKKYIPTVKHCLYSFFACPMEFIKLLLERKH